MAPAHLDRKCSVYYKKYSFLVKFGSSYSCIPFSRQMCMIYNQNFLWDIRISWEPSSLVPRDYPTLRHISSSSQYAVYYYILPPTLISSYYHYHYHRDAVGSYFLDTATIIAFIHSATYYHHGRLAVDRIFLLTATYFHPILLQHVIFMTRW